MASVRGSAKTAISFFFPFDKRSCLSLDLQLGEEMDKGPFRFLSPANVHELQLAADDIREAGEIRFPNGDLMKR